MHLRAITFAIGLTASATASAAQSKAYVVDSAWEVIRVDHPPAPPGSGDDQGANVLHFRNGHRLVVGLVEVAFLGQLPRLGRPPIILVRARGCYACDIETQVYAFPADADSIGWGLNGYRFAGTLRPDDPDDSAVFYRGRLFIGRCLSDHNPAAVWFQADRDSTGHWKNRVYRLAVDADSARGAFLNPRPPLTTTLQATKAGACVEIPGIDDIEG